MNKIIVADAIQGLKQLPDAFFDTCVTSPPYFGLRDYGVDGQIGHEATPEAYVGRLVEVFREVWRVLKIDGTLWLNIGDSYATSSGSQPPTNTRNSLGHCAKSVPDGYKRKDLIGIPWLLAFALREDGWYLRQDIIWHKPNPMPESVKDRCTKSHEYLFLLSKSPKYYFNGEAISEPVTKSTVLRLSQDVASQKGSFRQEGKSNGPVKALAPRFGGNKYDNGEIYARTKSGKPYELQPKKNKRDVWSISTTPFKGAHFAVFPPELVRPCVLAGSRPGGTILDPFFGSGTTGMVAIQEGRGYVGIDINPLYAEIAAKRLGVFAKVVSQ